MSSSRQSSSRSSYPWSSTIATAASVVKLHTSSRKVLRSSSAFFLAAILCAAVRAGVTGAGVARVCLVRAILAGLSLVWSIRRVVYGKLRRPFCFRSEGASSKRGRANARRRRKGCGACERQQAPSMQTDQALRSSAESVTFAFATIKQVGSNKLWNFRLRYKY